MRRSSGWIDGQPEPQDLAVLVAKLNSDAGGSGLFAELPRTTARREEARIKRLPRAAKVALLSIGTQEGVLRPRRVGPFVGPFCHFASVKSGS